MGDVSCRRERQVREAQQLVPNTSTSLDNEMQHIPALHDGTRCPGEVKRWLGRWKEKQALCTVTKCNYCLIFTWLHRLEKRLYKEK